MIPAEMPEFLSPAPDVRLVNRFDRPFDNAVATARTCYSANGVVTAETVGGDRFADPERRQRAVERRDALARDIFSAGHHTTFQHAHFQFALSNVSRQFIWTFLHSHPHYNSEQVSQRYVEVRPDAFVVPDLSAYGPGAQQEFQRGLDRAAAAYRALIEALIAPAAEQYWARFPARARKPEAWEGELARKAQEIARYALPLATIAWLYHTVSAITLLRYHRLCESLDAPTEQRLVVRRMVDELLQVDPAYRAVLEEPIPLDETLEYRLFQTGAGSVGEAGRRRFRQEFDAELGGKVSVLVDWKANNEAVLARSVREVLGVPSGSISDDDAIALVLDPARNPYLGETLNVAPHSKLMRAMAHPSWTFRKKLSHTADSQDQRHRATPGARPALAAYLSEEPDYIVPGLLRESPAAMRLYSDAMDAAWESIGRLRKMGVPDEMRAYLLPNAVAIRFTESADLLGLHHKMAMRLCFNAQEEIWRASLDEAAAVREVNPRIGALLLPPCGIRIRAGTTPWCPEGKRYCGVPVWRYDLSQYERVI